MGADTSFSVPEQLHVESLSAGPDGITIYTAPKDPGGRCPGCGGRSCRVHSRFAGKERPASAGLPGPIRTLAARKRQTPGFPLPASAGTSFAGMTVMLGAR